MGLGNDDFEAEWLVVCLLLFGALQLMLILNVAE
jgi:hypothetical protein